MDTAHIPLIVDQQRYARRKAIADAKRRTEESHIQFIREQAWPCVQRTVARILFGSHWRGLECSSCLPEVGCVHVLEDGAVEMHFTVHTATTPNWPVEVNAASAWSLLFDCDEAGIDDLPYAISLPKPEIMARLTVDWALSQLGNAALTLSLPPVTSDSHTATVSDGQGAWSGTSDSRTQAIGIAVCKWLDDPKSATHRERLGEAASVFRAMAEAPCTPS